MTITPFDAQTRDLLLSKSAVTDFTGRRIYADVRHPAEYHPDPTNPTKGPKGPSILIFSRPMRPVSATGVVRNVSLIVQSFGANRQTAEQLDIQVEKELDNASYGNIRRASVDVPAQFGRHEDTGWPFVETTFLLVTAGRPDQGA